MRAMPPSLEQRAVANDKFFWQSKTPENPCRQHPFGLISYQGRSIEDLHKEEALAEMVCWTQDCGAAVGTTMYSGFVCCIVLMMMWVWKLGFKKSGCNQMSDHQRCKQRVGPSSEHAWNRNVGARDGIPECSVKGLILWHKL